MIFLDQSQVFHELLPIQTLENQVGGMQLYVPTILANYMNKTLVFEGHEKEGFYTNEKTTQGRYKKYFN